MNIKYTDEMIIEAVQTSITFSDVCRKLGCKPTGGTYYNIHTRIKKLGIDISHFDRSHFCRNVKSVKRKNHQEVLVHNTNSVHREKGHRLRRALLESGRKHECEVCGNKGVWNKTTLVLQVDHKDGDWKNNKKDNLRFLCPNCHSQTENFGIKNI